MAKKDKLPEFQKNEMLLIRDALVALRQEELKLSIEMNESSTSRNSKLKGFDKVIKKALDYYNCLVR